MPTDEKIDRMTAKIAAAMRERFPMLDPFKSFELAAIAQTVIAGGLEPLSDENSGGSE